MKFIAALLACLTLLVGCTPEESSPIPTTTTNATTSTSTSQPQFEINLTPSGGDDTDLISSALEQYPVVNILGPMVAEGTIILDGLTDRVINFSPDGEISRPRRNPERTSQVLLIKNSNNIVINNAVIKGPNFEVCGFEWTDPITNIPRYIRVGYNPSFEAQHGIEINSSQNVAINNPNVYGVSGDGIYIASRGISQAENIEIINPHISCSGRNSISNVGSTNVSVTGGELREAGLWILNVEPTGVAEVHDYTVEGTVLGFSNREWLFSSGPYFSCLITNVNIDVTLDRSDQRYRTLYCVAEEFNLRY